MRNTLLASLLTLTAACTADSAALAPAQSTLPSEPLALSVRGTQMTDPAGGPGQRAPVAVTASTSPAGPVWIETICQDTPVEAQVTQFKREYPATTAVQLGKAALLVDHGVRQQLTAWDTDSNCRVDITGPKDVDTVALARTLLGSLRS
jgi:hypothetical protein